MTQKLTAAELRSILREAAGEAPDPFGDDEFLDSHFEALGYDSLALLETSGRIERMLGITLDEAILGEAHTPRSFLLAVNSQPADDKVA